MKAVHNHSDVVNEVRSLLPDNNLLCDLGDLFKVFGDTTRIKIMFALFESESALLRNFSAWNNPPYRIS